MSLYFTKVIKAGDREREFNFKQLSSGTDLKYHVEVPDDKGNMITFHMYTDSAGRWKTAAQRIPLWIHNAEVSLNDAIQEQL